MKDFPVFTTQNGVASLILKEIPYRGEAYIRLRDSQDPEALLEECISFCRVCGAKKILAAGHPIVEQFPLHTIIYEMRGMISLSEEDVPAMFPVTEQTVAEWRTIYNRKMSTVDNAATLEIRDENDILSSGGAYFIHNCGEPLGIGWLKENRLEAIASLKPGMGSTVCKAMQSLIPQQQMTLEVASTNHRAIRLYESLGFLKTAELNRWYRVL